MQYLTFIYNSPKQKSMNAYEGTFSVLIPLPSFGEQNAHLVEKFIDQSDLCIDQDVNSGRPIETEPHITVQMGLTYDLEKLKNICKKIDPFELEIGGLDMFEGKNGKYEVLWRSVTAHPNLMNLHKLISDEFNRKWHFFKYDPHVTVAFLKHGVSKRYLLNSFPYPTKSIKVDRVIYRKFNTKEEEEIKLGSSDN